MTESEYILFQRSLPVSTEQDDIAMVDVTYECDAGCEYCYASGGEHRDILEIAKEIEETPQTTIILSGGEPLQHPEILDIVSIANLMGKKVCLLTNGRYLDTFTLNELLERGLAVEDGVPQICVSLQVPGYCKSHFDAFCNLGNKVVDALSFTVTSKADVKDAVKLAEELRGHYRAICLRTPWTPDRETVSAYDVVKWLGGELLPLPTPYAERSASVEKRGVHFKVISWPCRQNFDANVYSGKGIWYKGRNVVEAINGIAL